MGADGLPYKGTKSSTTTFLQRRYTDPAAVIQQLPIGWVPDTVILEGMFMIQISPLPTMSCMQDYVKLLISKFLQPHLRCGVKEIHVVFDAPGSQNESPKEIEQYRRDKTVVTRDIQHHCTSFCSDLLLTDKWRSILNCRTCKKELSVYIADDLLNLVSHHLHSNQRFVCNIGKQAFSIAPGRSRELQPELYTKCR